MFAWISSLFRSAERPPDHVAPPREQDDLPLIREYLIRRVDGDWFDIPRAGYEEIFRPESFDSEIIDGCGDHRIRVRDVEITFSYEDPGVQVSFFGAGMAEDESTKIVHEIAQKITKATRQESRVIAI